MLDPSEALKSSDQMVEAKEMIKKKIVIKEEKVTVASRYLQGIVAKNDGLKKDENECVKEPLTIKQENIKSNSLQLPRRRNKKSSPETVSWSSLPSKLLNPAKVSSKNLSKLNYLKIELNELFTCLNITRE